MSTEIERIRSIVSRVSCAPLGTQLKLLCFWDKAKLPQEGEPRVYLQVRYHAPDVHTAEPCLWSGRKWYLSEHMTEAEVLKTAWLAIEVAVRHELMESFLVDGKRLFNPHAAIDGLLVASNIEDKRQVR